MSSIGNLPPHISKLIQTATEKSQTETQIAYAVAGKQAQATKDSGEAAVKLIEQVVNMQKQLSNGRLDVHA